MKTSLRLSQKLTLKPRQKFITSIRLASFIKLGEKKFSECVIEVENDPVFRKLLSPESADLRVITLKNFTKAAFKFGNLPIKEQLSGDGTAVDVETVLADNKDAALLIKKIGLEKFEKYFLGSETVYPGARISAECGISEESVVRINELINDLSVRSEFYHPSGLEIESRVSYAKIAEIEFDGKDSFNINYFSPKYITGRYIVNNAKLSALKKQNIFSPEENSKIKSLIEKIELINARKTTIYQIISKIIEVQKNYLYSGEEKFLVPYTQKQLSEDIGVDKSVVCRAIYGRSVVTPRGVEKPLKYFFRKNKDIRKNLIKKIIKNEKRKLTDSKIVILLKNEFNITASRRSVNVCRNELFGKKEH